MSAVQGFKPEEFYGPDVVGNARVQMGLSRHEHFAHPPRTKDGYDFIKTWVDRLTRRVHFLKSKTTDTAEDTANDFCANIFKKHGLPGDIVSDQDSKFRSNFWKRLMELCGVNLILQVNTQKQTKLPKS